MARREWKKGEEMYMTRMYLRQPIEKTAKVLNRSVPSVKHKAIHLGLKRCCGENLSMRDVANCFSTDCSVVKRWMEKFDLPYAREHFYSINAKEFWKWAYKHKEEINWSKYQEKSILPEPDWVSEEIKKCNKTKKHRSKVTQMEKIYIKNLLHKGLSYREISKITGRTYYSISHICRTIYK